MTPISCELPDDAFGSVPRAFIASPIIIHRSDLSRPHGRFLVRKNNNIFVLNSSSYKWLVHTRVDWRGVQLSYYSFIILTKILRNARKTRNFSCLTRLVIRPVPNRPGVGLEKCIIVIFNFKLLYNTTRSGKKIWSSFENSVG